MISILFLSQQIQTDMPKGAVEAMVALAIMLPIVVILGLVIREIRKKTILAKEQQSQRAFMLSDIRRLHSDGALSDEEFETIKTRLAKKSKANMLNKEVKEDTSLEAMYEQMKKRQTLNAQEQPIAESENTHTTTDQPGAVSSESSPEAESVQSNEPVVDGSPPVPDAPSESDSQTPAEDDNERFKP